MFCCDGLYVGIPAAHSVLQLVRPPLSWPRFLPSCPPSLDLDHHPTALWTTSLPPAAGIFYVVWTLSDPTLPHSTVLGSSCGSSEEVSLRVLHWAKSLPWNHHPMGFYQVRVFIENWLLYPTLCKQGRSDIQNTESSDGPQCGSVIMHFLRVVKYRKKTMLIETFLNWRRWRCAQRKIYGLKSFC